MSDSLPLPLSDCVCARPRVCAVCQDLEKFESDAMTVRAAANAVKDILDSHGAGKRNGASGGVPEGVPPAVPEGVPLEQRLHVEEQHEEQEEQEGDGQVLHMRERPA